MDNYLNLRYFSGTINLNLDPTLYPMNQTDFARVVRIFQKVDEAGIDTTTIEKFMDFLSDCLKTAREEKAGTIGTTAKKADSKINAIIRNMKSFKKAFPWYLESYEIDEKGAAPTIRMKGTVVEALCGNKYDPRIECKPGYTFTYNGLQFDVYEAGHCNWNILVNGTGRAIGSVKSKSDVKAFFTEDMNKKLASDEFKTIINNAIAEFNRVKVETTAADEVVPVANQSETVKTQEGENMNEEKTVVQVEEVTQVEKQPAEVVTDEKVEEVFGKEFIEDMEKTAADLAAEAAQTAKVETVTQEAQPETIDPAALTAENIAAYLPALLMSLANDKHNTSIILAAGIEAGAINPIALLDYFQTGRMPAVHTFDVWKKAGYTVRKGEHAAFTARIWKYTEKTQEAETENDEEGEAITTHNFIKKVAYFFTAAQVDKTPEPAALPELPADVKMEVRKGCQWISGNTRPIKEALKAAGFRWSKNNSAWYRRAA